MEFDLTQVFIVHGHDDNAKLELARIIDKDLGLNSVILHEQPNAGRTIIEKLERYSSSPGFAFVLLTPDDLGSHKDDTRSETSSQTKRHIGIGIFYRKNRTG